MGFGPTSSDISAPPPGRPQDAQFLGNVLKRGVLWKPLKGICQGLLVSRKEEPALTPPLGEFGMRNAEWRRKPPLSHPEATPKPSGSQPVATLKPPGGYPEATRRLP
jgi:hypothetical protein